MMDTQTLIKLVRRAALAASAVGVAAAATLLTACAPMPVGPTVAVMPGQNKPFEVFVQEDHLCRNWAYSSTAQPGDPAANQMLASTITGTAIGAVAGAMAGGHNSTGTGAAVGTLFGASVGSQQSAGTAWSAQRRYNVAYSQCMYAKGNVIPGAYERSPYLPPPPPR